MEKLLMKKILFIFLVVITFNSCILFGLPDCPSNEEAIANLPPGTQVPIENIYHIINELDSNLELRIYYTNNFTSSSVKQLFLPSDTLRADGTLFASIFLESPPPKKFIVNDSVEIVFQSNPKVCLKYRGNITDSLTDIRSRNSFQAEELEQTEEVSNFKTSFVKNWMKKIGFWFTSVFKGKKNIIVAGSCGGPEIIVNNFFKVNETNLNQATEEACTEQ